MGSTSAGMKAGGYYDAHSEYQRRVVELGDEVVRRIIAALGADEIGETFTVADYGAGTGASSVHAVGTAIDAALAAAPEARVTAIHNDVAENDFGGLFRTVAGRDGYLRPGRTVLPMASAGSFFTQVTPAGIVDLGMCSNAAHWYREQPDVAVPEGMYFDAATGAAREALARQAADDWLAFLGSRARELAPGGRMMVQGIATATGPGGEELVSASKLLAVMWAVAEGLAADGLIDGEALERYVLPVYCRSAGEATAPLAAGAPLEGAFGVEVADTDEVANPYWELLERDGDRATYAAAYTAFVRAFSEPTMRVHLFEPGARGIEPAKLADEFFSRFEAANADHPDAGRYEAWVLRLVVRRTGS